MRAWQILRNRFAALTVAALASSSTSSLAVPVNVISNDEPLCDVLLVPSTVADELGTSAAFPAGERILSASLGRTNRSCTATDIATVSDFKVSITNFTTNPAFSAVWYVADQATSITNFDGKVNGALAFRIDAIGLNKPLLSESILPNGVFDPGETWEFVLQDYTNAFSQAPHLFGSIGVPSNVALDSSTGSIIALEVPEPRALLLLGVGLVGIVIRWADQRGER